MAVQEIAVWRTPFDTGPPPTERQYFSPFLPAGWTHLSAVFSDGSNFAGSFRIAPGSTLWFNRYPQPPYPFNAVHPDQSFVTDSTSRMEITTVNGGPGTIVTVQLFGEVFVPAPNCEYGTQLKTPGQFIVYLTPGLIDVALAALDMAWAAPFFTAWWFTQFDASGLCGSGPPAAPPIDGSIVNAGPDTLFSILRLVLWNYLCECKPGTPAPIPYPPPSATPPAGLPPPPSFSCSPEDLCSSIVAIRQQLAALSSTVAGMNDLITVVQRYHVPLEYIPGATHSAIQDEGSFQVSRLLGVRVTLTARPDSIVVKRGNPDYLWDLGWLSIVDGSNQLLAEVRLTREVQIWLPPLFAAADRFCWSLFPDVVVQVTELQAEP